MGLGSRNLEDAKKKGDNVRGLSETVKALVKAMMEEEQAKLKAGWSTVCNFSSLLCYLG